jgi:hypothetical protein
MFAASRDTWTSLEFVDIVATVRGSRAWAAGAMAYEYPTVTGVLHLQQVRRRWVVWFKGHKIGQWRSPDAAASAIARHQSGLAQWDQLRFDVSDDLLDWRPLGDSL